MTGDPTLDPARVSWVPVPTGSDFPIQNLPFGVFSVGAGAQSAGVAIGDHILGLAAAARSGAFADIDLPGGVFADTVLNRYLALGRDTWRAVRARVSEILTEGSSYRRNAQSWLVAADEATLHLPVAVGDYVDFYSSLHHATNVGKIFRPSDPPLMPNWRHMPIGYHGRASSIVVSGTPVVRPRGQRPGPDGPTMGASRKLDIELEVGFVTGPGNDLGTSIPIGEAENHIFGLCLVNDWSARDIQAWEYRPLGPFLGKSFATSMSPWIVTLDALAPFRVASPLQDPAPLRYLEPGPRGSVDLDLQVELNGDVVAEVGFAEMYWTMGQQLAHATVNGTNTRPGDLYASGTVSGPTPGSLGSLLELSWNGERPISLASGETRTFLEDGDTVVLRGRCQAPGAVSIGFGPCEGTITPAV